MDPIEKVELPGGTETTLGDLISYMYEKVSEVYDSPELRNLAVATMLDDLLSRSQAH